MEGAGSRNDGYLARHAPFKLPGIDISILRNPEYPIQWTARAVRGPHLQYQPYPVNATFMQDIGYQPFQQRHLFAPEG